MVNPLLPRRGTRAQLNAAAASSALRQGELYHITDEGRLAVATGAGAYQVAERQGDLAIVFEFEGGGAPLPVGLRAWRRIPFAYTIVGWDLLAADTDSGSVTVDVRTSSYAQYPTTTSIAGTNKPAIPASGLKSAMATLSGWTTSIAASQVVEARIEAATGLTRLVLTLVVRRT